MSSSSLTAPTASTYKKRDLRTHVYLEPDIYICSAAKMLRPEWVYDAAKGQIVTKDIEFPYGCERIFLEILSNASDNANRSRRAKVDPGIINVTMNDTTVTVTNHGLPIPVEMHPTEHVYVPELIFGSLLTSSNYETERHEAGKNGVGAKATNIFSTRFEVKIEDHIRHLSYTQTWETNMTICHPPTITPFDGKSSSVTVTYDMDFERFGYSDGYPEEAEELFHRHCIDISCMAKIGVTFNEHLSEFTNIKEYGRLYFGDQVETALVHYQWPPGCKVIRRKNGEEVAKEPGVLPIVELLAVDTPDEGQDISFVNSLMTREGGVHVQEAFKAVGGPAVKIINEQSLKRLARSAKGKEIDTKDKNANTINIKEVRGHISLLLSVRVVNPGYTSQTKSFLSEPTPRIRLEESELKIFGRWKLIERLHAALEAKLFNSLSKTDGKLRRYVKLEHGVDANEAGKAERHKCWLWITEGHSGSTYAESLLDLVPGGRNYAGVLPMKGKGLNVMNARDEQLQNNKGISELKKMLGLCEGMDYEIEENFERLRYGGGVMIMADSDLDGLHIIGLLLLFFNCRFPSLLKRGFVCYYKTPILRVTYNRKVRKFYSQREYEEWAAKTPNADRWVPKYYKGLGSSGDEDIADDYKTKKIVLCVYDELTPGAMELAFNKKLSDRRKEWIMQFNPALQLDVISSASATSTEQQLISSFITYEMVLFSIANLQRAIPRLLDGFKESQRKVMFGVHKEWTITTSTKIYEQIKVAQLAAAIAKCSNYHHGEDNLNDVIIGMVQRFVGSNNIPWLCQEGQFGTRFYLGKNAPAPRYIHTMPEAVMPYIIRREDDPILVRIKEEGKVAEPISYYPVIPMVLVNGCQGIATGFSTLIPNHNPLDLINWIKTKLEGNTPSDTLVPWYRGFRGKIEIIERVVPGKVKIVQRTRVGTKVTTVNDSAQLEVTEDQLLPEEKETVETPEDEEEEVVLASPPRPLYSMRSQGIFEENSKGNIIITELPLGRSTHNYCKWLDTMVEEKKISGYRNMSSKDVINFELMGFKGKATSDNLKLVRIFPLTNMVLLDENNLPRHYDSSVAIIQEFFARRLPIYQQRKESMLASMKKTIAHLNDKIRFIEAVLDGSLVLINNKIASITETMKQLNIPIEIYNESRTRNLSEDDILELKKKVAALRAEEQALTRSSIEELWYRDLNELEQFYLKMKY